MKILLSVIMSMFLSFILYTHPEDDSFSSSHKVHTPFTVNQLSTHSAQSLRNIFNFHNRIEKSGIVEFSNKVMYSDGFYKAELRFNGKIAKHKATFFPAHWTNEQVIDAIFEAYDNFIKSNKTPKMNPSGTITIHGRLKNNIIIEIYLTKKGKIITGYPLLL